MFLGGRIQSGTNHYFTGFMDDVRIYDHALSAAEVLALAVPEPGRGVLLVGAMLAWTLRRRR